MSLDLFKTALGVLVLVCMLMVMTGAVPVKEDNSKRDVILNLVLKMPQQQPCGCCPAGHCCCSEHRNEACGYCTCQCGCRCDMSTSTTTSTSTSTTTSTSTSTTTSTSTSTTPSTTIPDVPPGECNIAENRDRHGGGIFMTDPSDNRIRPFRRNIPTAEACCTLCQSLMPLCMSIAHIKAGAPRFEETCWLKITVPPETGGPFDDLREYISAAAVITDHCRFWSYIDPSFYSGDSGLLNCTKTGDNYTCTMPTGSSALLSSCSSMIIWAALIPANMNFIVQADPNNENGGKILLSCSSGTLIASGFTETSITGTVVDALISIRQTGACCLIDELKYSNSVQVVFTPSNMNIPSASAAVISNCYVVQPVRFGRTIADICSSISSLTATIADISVSCSGNPGEVGKWDNSPGCIPLATPGGPNILCNDGTTQISCSDWCNGLPDCPAGDDELGCPGPCNTTHTSANNACGSTLLDTMSAPVEGGWYFQCAPGQCIGCANVCEGNGEEECIVPNAGHDETAAVCSS